MILTLKIKLLGGMYAKKNWECVIEIEASSTLEALHYTIQSAVNFENDHLYEFYSARTERSRQRIRFDDENEEIFTRAIETIFPLEKGRKFFYMFDYGDSWLFQISKLRNKPFEAQTDIEYPSMISELGEKPEQYPVWDEDED